MNVLILHGIGGHAGIHWQQWLHDMLSEAGHTVLMPDLTNPSHPDRTEWRKEAEQALKNVNIGQLVIVGHSLGVATALVMLSKACLRR